MDETGETVHMPAHPHAANTGILLHLPDFQKDLTFSFLDPKQSGMKKPLIRHRKLCFFFPNLVDGKGEFVFSVRKLKAEPVSRNFGDGFQGGKENGKTVPGLQFFSGVRRKRTDSPPGFLF